MDLSVVNRELIKLAENEVFIFLTYFFGIGAWAIVAKHDFISGNWKSVIETRKSGQVHVIIVLIPMAYVGFYIYILGLKRDFKLGAAVFALGFATLHLLRTIFALWQLVVFKAWAVSGIDSIESLGYRCYTSNGIEPDLDGQKLSEKEATDIRIDFIADNIKISNQVVENKLSSGVGIAKLKLVSKRQQKYIAERKFSTSKIFLLFFFSMSSILRLPFVIVALFFPKLWDLSDENCAPYLEPIFSEEIFVRWACTLVANACPDFLEDMRNLCKKPESINVSERDLRREEFALEVLLNAGMHLRARSTTGKLSGFRTSGNDFGCTKDFCSFRHNFLPFEEWKAYPILRKGLFRREEFLKRACLSGKGLPFHASHFRARLVENGGESFSYSKFGTFLNQAKLALDAEDEEACVDLGVVELEWLSVFLSIDNWQGICPESKRAQEEELRKSKKKRFVDSRPKKKKTRIDQSGLPLSNLSLQLGYKRVTPRMMQYFSHPVLKTSYDRTLWENRNVLELSAHIDNWLALRSGDKAVYMMDQMNHHDEDFLFRNIELSCESASKYQLVFERSVRIQIDQSMFQFSLIKPEHDNYEHGMSFLGCSMEVLRSSLARWTNRNSLMDEEVWSPKVSTNLKESTFVFRASEDLQFCTKSIESVSYLNEKFFQMRLLWELQSYFHASMSRSNPKAAGPMDTEAIILCILSFPSLVMTVEPNEDELNSRRESQSSWCMNRGNDADCFHIDHYKINISAGCGPQEIDVLVSFKLGSELTLNVSIYSDEPSAIFSWEAWKHSFLGRLEGVRQWQNDWNLPNVPVFRTEYPISSAMKMHRTLNSRESEGIIVWEGWIPHRPRLCQFELETKGFIKRRLEVPRDRKFISVGEMHVASRINVERFIEVDYANSDPESFRRASIFAVEAIINDFSNRSQDEIVEEDLRTEFMRRTKEASRDKYFAIELLKYSSAEFGAVEDLKTVIGLLSTTDRFVEESVLVLERFYSVYSNSELFFSDSEKVSCTENLFEKLLVDSKYSSKVAKAFSKFYTIALSYGQEQMYGQARKMLFQSMIENMRSSNKRAAIECRFALQDLVRTDRSEELSFTKTALLTTIDPRSRLLYGEDPETEIDPRKQLIPGYSFLKWMKQSLKKTTREVQIDPNDYSFDNIDLERGISDARETLEVLSRAGNE